MEYIGLPISSPDIAPPGTSLLCFSIGRSFCQPINRIVVLFWPWPNLALTTHRNTTNRLARVPPFFPLFPSFPLSHFPSVPIQMSSSTQQCKRTNINNIADSFFDLIMIQTKLNHKIDFVILPRTRPTWLIVLIFQQLAIPSYMNDTYILYMYICINIYQQW